MGRGGRERGPPPPPPPPPPLLSQHKKATKVTIVEAKRVSSVQNFSVGIF